MFSAKATWISCPLETKSFWEVMLKANCQPQKFKTLILKAALKSSILVPILSTCPLTVLEHMEFNQDALKVKSIWLLSQLPILDTCSFKALIFKTRSKSASCSEQVKVEHCSFTCMIPQVWTFLSIFFYHD